MDALYAKVRAGAAAPSKEQGGYDFLPELVSRRGSCVLVCSVKPQPLFLSTWAPCCVPLKITLLSQPVLQVDMRFRLTGEGHLQELVGLVWLGFAFMNHFFKCF